jgi:predicted glycosyltransferase
MTTTRLDILLYAHDGRGLGHISRTVAIAMALRRIRPDLRVLVTGGSAFTGELALPGTLDWIKLPSYETVVRDGRAQGIDGPSGFSDSELAELRKKQLCSIIGLYRPRLVLVDHQPQGKHRELVPAMEASRPLQTRWFLGVRGVIGAVPQAGTKLGRELFNTFFSGLLWYGDSEVLGNEHKERLQEQYSHGAVECGYVSRLREILHRKQWSLSGRKAGTIAVPWHGEHSGRVLDAVVSALRLLGSGHGRWSLFADLDAPLFSKRRAALEEIPGCTLLQPGSLYLKELMCSKTALVYGGYNSLTDILAAGIPAVVLLRSMRDNEQQEHVRLLCRHTGDRLVSLDERQVSGSSLAHALETRLRMRPRPSNIALDGAQCAARELVRSLA